MTITKADTIEFAKKQKAKAQRTLHSIHNKTYSEEERQNLMRKVGYFELIIKTLESDQNYF